MYLPQKVEFSAHVITTDITSNITQVCVSAAPFDYYTNSTVEYHPTMYYHY